MVRDILLDGGGQFRYAGEHAAAETVLRNIPEEPALKAQQEFTALSGGLVFHDTLHNAGWDTNKAVLGRWRITLRKAKVRYRNLYQTRHTFASTLLSAGANPLYVAKQMGHRDTEMINRHYGRWLEQGSGEETRRQSAEFFAKVWPKLEGQKPKPA